MIRATLFLSVALLLGRLLGFLREVLLAGRVGVSVEADIAILVMTLPEFVVGVLLAGGFTAALVPALRQQEAPARPALFRLVATLALLIGGLIAAAIAVAPCALATLLAPGLVPEGAEIWTTAIRLVALSIPLAALAGAVGAWANVQDRFFVVGLGTVLYNVILCAALLALAPGASLILALALATVCAGAGRLALLILVARPPLLPRLGPVPGGDRRLLGLFAAGVLAVGTAGAAHLIFRSLAAAGGAGELAAFTYALKLFLLPVTIFFGPLATVLLPRMASAPADAAIPARGLALILPLALATVVVGLVSGDALARLVFLRGEMTLPGVGRVIVFAKLMMLALPFAA
ncbi:MAG: lipid II flippase MurJ, partial [Pseudomonadota bacterium]